MTGQLILAWFVRLVHITSAVALIGGPFFVRVALLPAAGEAVDEEARRKLQEAIGRRWRKAVYLLITLLILTGAFNFFAEIRLPAEAGQVKGTLITGRWREMPEHDQQVYQMLFGIKMLAAFALFFLASVLAGRMKTFEAIRRNARTSITILLLLGGLALVCATLMHYLPLQPGPELPVPGALP